MATEPVVQFGENSPEYVAYRLYRDIANSEGKSLIATGTTKPDRKWILDTYGECLWLVKNPAPKP